MSDMITDVASPAAIKAHIGNFAAFWSCYGNAPGGEVHDTPEITQFLTGTPFPLFNGVLRANIPADKLDAAIDAAVARFSARGVPAFWWVGPTTEPANLAEALLNHGFALAGNTPGMAAVLDPAVLNRPLPSGLTIRLVEDSATVNAYLQTLVVGSEIPDPLHAVLLSGERTMIPPEGAELRRYVGIVNGKPVATSAMIMYAGVAGIYAVATLPEARRQGFGNALTVYALREAYERGYQVGTLQASEMGYPVYQKIGFQTVCTFALYMWGAE